MTDEKRICQRCVLTEGTPGISFGAAGVCSYCATYESKMNVLGEEALRRLLSSEKERKKSRAYDCAAGISGGRDSTYTLYKLVKDYKMRVLGIHYDNPFTSPQARENMSRAAEILGVKVVDWRFAEGEHLNATRKALRIWARRPSSKLIPILCAHCKNVWPPIFKQARAHDVSLIVIGSNPLETASFKAKGFGGARTYHKLTNLPKIVSGTAREILANPGYLTLSWKLILSMYLGASHSSPYLRKIYRDINVIRLFDYLRWDEGEVERTIERELGWRKSPEVESSWRFDCRLDYVRRQMYAATVGVTELRDLFSKMIREGMLTRAEALSRLEREEPVKRDVADSVLGQLGLKWGDLNLGDRPEQ